MIQHMNIYQKGFVNKGLIIFVVIVLLGMVGYFALNNRSKTTTPALPIDAQLTPPPSLILLPPSKPIPVQTLPGSLLRDCPEEWYENRMPGIIGPNDVPKEYFVYKGVRRELYEFDVNWVKTNCSVKSEAVY